MKILGERSFSTSIIKLIEKDAKIKLRANNLLNDSPATETRSRLSGYTIGLEIAGSRHFWLGNNVIIVGTHPVAEIYSEVLKKQGVKSRIFLSNELSLNGLKVTYQSLLND